MRSLLGRWLQHRKKPSPRQTFWGLRDKAQPFAAEFTANPSIRKLEPRRVLSITAANLAGNGVLTITLDNANDNVTLQENAGLLEVLDGAVVDSTFDPTLVDSIVVNDGGGTDTVTFDPTTNTLSLPGVGGDSVVTDSVEELVFAGAHTLDANLEITNGGVLASAGSLTVSGDTNITAGTNTVDLSNAANDFVGSVSITSDTNVTIADSDTIDFGTSSIGGDLDVTVAVGDITDSGVVDVDGMAQFNATSGAINVDQLDVAGSIGLVSQTTATVVNTTAVDLKASTVGTDLDVTATTGDITDSDVVDVDGMAQFNAPAGAINLDQLDITGSIGLLAQTTATIVNTTAVDLKASTVGTDLDVTATTGNITDSGVVDVDGMGQFNAPAGTINLDQLDVTGSIGLLAQTSATIVNTTAVDLKASTVGTDLDVTATTGNITDSGVVDVDGMGQFNAPAGTINLDQLDVSGSIGLLAQTTATIVNTTAVDLKASAVGTDLDVTATTGNITDSGVVDVDGMAQFNAPAGAINLDQLDVTGSIGLLAQTTATIVNTTAVDLKASTVGTDLDVTATTGNITDSGVVDVNGMAQFDAPTGAINLDQLDVSGSIGLLALTSATIVNTTAVDLKASTVGTDLDVTATTGNITDSGLVDVNGMAQFTTSQTDNLADAVNADISLNQLAVTGSIGLTTNGNDGDAAIVNATGIDFKATNVGGDLTGTATTGGITQSGSIVVGNDSTLNGNAILLGNNAGDILTVGGLATFNAATSVDVGTAAGTTANFDSLSLSAINATVTEDSDTHFDGVTVTNDLTLESESVITQTPQAVIVNGDTTLGLRSASAHVYLARASSRPATNDGVDADNQFDGLLTINGAGITSDVHIRNTSATATFPVFGVTTQFNNLEIWHTATDVSIPAFDFDIQQDLTIRSDGGNITDDANTKLAVGNDAFYSASQNIALVGDALIVSVDAEFEADQAISVMGNQLIVGVEAKFTANQAINATGNQLDVGNLATFTSLNDDSINVNAGSTTFGSLNFDGGDVTIAEDDSTLLEDSSDAINLLLSSLGDIEDTAGATNALNVADKSLIDAVGDIILGNDNAVVTFGHVATNTGDYLVLNATNASLTVASDVNLGDDSTLGFEVTNELILNAPNSVIAQPNGGSADILQADIVEMSAGAIILKDTDFGQLAATATGSSDVTDPTELRLAELPLDIPNTGNTGMSMSRGALTPINPGLSGGQGTESELFTLTLGDNYGVVISNHGNLSLKAVTSSEGSVYIESLEVLDSLDPTIVLEDGNLLFNQNASVMGGSAVALTAVAEGTLDISIGVLLQSLTGAVLNVGPYDAFSDVVKPPGLVNVTSGPLLQVTQPNDKLLLDADGSNTSRTLDVVLGASFRQQAEFEIGRALPGPPGEDPIRETNFTVVVAYVDDLAFINPDAGIIDVGGETYSLKADEEGESFVVGTQQLGMMTGFDSTFDIGIDDVGNGYTVQSGTQIVDQDPAGMVDNVAVLAKKFELTYPNENPIHPAAPMVIRAFNDPLINLYTADVSQSDALDISLKLDDVDGFTDLNESKVDVTAIDPNDLDPDKTNKPGADLSPPGLVMLARFPLSPISPDASRPPERPPLFLPPPPPPDLAPLLQDIPPEEFDDVRPFVLAAIEEVKYGPVDEESGKFKVEPEVWKEGTAGNFVQEIKDKIDSDDRYEPGPYEIEVQYKDGSFDEYRHVKQFESSVKIDDGFDDLSQFRGKETPEFIAVYDGAWQMWALPPDDSGNAVEPAALDHDSSSQESVGPRASALMAAAIVAQRSRKGTRSEQNMIRHGIASSDWSRLARLRRRIATVFLNS